MGLHPMEQRADSLRDREGTGVGLLSKGRRGDRGGPTV